MGAAADDASSPTAIDLSSGAYIISAGGTYQLPSASGGTITIETTDAVTIVGNGATGTANSGLTITCTSAAASLTLQDVYISSPNGGGNVINFTGAGNTLTIEGTSLLENSAYGAYAMVHVGANDACTLEINGGGTLYLYKYCAGAGIGGNANEANGSITISGGTLLIKGSKTGPLIGNDTCGIADEEAKIGDVTIAGGDITLIPKAQGAGIGGSRMSIGGNVNMTGGTLTVISDFSTGIGGGGQKNSTITNNGNLYMTGGSLRAVRTGNSLSGNGDSSTQTVDDSLITANRFDAPGGNALYRLAFNTALLNTVASSFTALVDGKCYYTGGLHRYYYSESTSSTVENFSLATAENGYLDTNLYFYLTGSDHKLTVNGRVFTAKWDSATSTFTVSAGDGTSSAPYIITTAAQLTALADKVNAGDNCANTFFKLGEDIDLSTVCGTTGFTSEGVYDGISTNAKSWTPIGGGLSVKTDLPLTSQADLDTALTQHAIIYDNVGNSYVPNSDKNGAYDSGRTYYYLTGAPFAGVFDGSGKTISNLCVSTSVGYAGLFGDVSGTVKNLIVSGSVTSTTTQDFVGGIVGKLSAGGTISGCTSQVTVTANSAFNVGGIAGFVGEPGVFVSTSNPMATVEKCINTGAVSGNSRTGGIVGRNAGTVTLCENIGAVFNASGKKKGTGGIVGMNGVNNTAEDAGILTNCYNTGFVNSNAGYWTGGIAGFQNARSSTANCYNAGTLYTSNTATGSLYSWVNPVVGQNEGSTSSCYWLNTDTKDNTANYIGSDPTGVGSASGGTVTNCTGKTSDEMQTAAFARLMGSAYHGDAATPVNGGYPVLSWQGGRAICAVTLPADTGYTVSPVMGYSTVLFAGSDFKFTVVMDSGYTLNYVQAQSSTLTAAEGVYTVPNITSDKTISLNFTKSSAGAGTGASSGGNPGASVWDGQTIDIRWFDPSAVTFHISTPAELAGLAALVNGIYNSDIQYVCGNTAYIVDKQATGTSGSNNNATPDFHYGAYDFDGCTIYLDSDINMGSGNNYMPIGGQYLMDTSNTATRIDASFNGTLDGQGNTVTVYCNRWATDYGNGSSIGLIGRLGCHDSDVANGINTLASGCAVRNLAVAGSIRGNRSVGGIVGKIGKTNGDAIIENCANFASVIGTDAKGTGGICGAAWNGGAIRNCYNAGRVTNSYENAGGIAGSCEVAVENSYNVGTVTSSANNAMGIATNNGGASFTNCWYLDTSASDGGVYPASAGGSGKVEKATAAAMKAASFVKSLGSAFAADTAGINGGYPVLRWQSSSSGTSGTAGTPGTSIGVDVTVASSTTVTGGTASISVTESDISTSIAAAQKDSASALVIKADTNGKTASVTEVTLPTASAQAIAKENLSLTAETADGTRVTLSPTALSSAVSQASGSALKISVTPETVKQAAAVINATGSLKSGDFNLADSVTIQVLVKSSDKTLYRFAGNLIIDLPVDSTKYAMGQSYRMIQISADGSTELLAAKCVSVDGKLYARATVTHLSTFVITAEKAMSFGDVSSNAWYGNAVAYVTGKGLMNGTGDSTFSPQRTMTRTMLVTVLYRLDGSPAVSSKKDFSDVKDGSWYSDAVTWASANGIVLGYAGNTFSPDSSITRQQMAAILYRYAQYKGYDVSAGADTNILSYTDAPVISEYAVPAFQWACGAGVINGNGANALAPNDPATRAQVATIVMRFCQNVTK